MSEPTPEPIPDDETAQIVEEFLQYRARIDNVMREIMDRACFALNPYRQSTWEIVAVHTVFDEDNPYRLANAHILAAKMYADRDPADFARIIRVSTRLATPSQRFVAVLSELAMLMSMTELEGWSQMLEGLGATDDEIGALIVLAAIEGEPADNRWTRIFEAGGLALDVSDAFMADGHRLLLAKMATPEALPDEASGKLRDFYARYWKRRGIDWRVPEDLPWP